MQILKSPEDQIEHIPSNFMRERDPLQGGQQQWSHFILGRQHNHYNQTDPQSMFTRFLHAQQVMQSILIMPRDTSQGCM